MFIGFAIANMSTPSLIKKTRSYLDSLTKEELINLILKFAPQSFFDAIESQFVSQSEAIKILNSSVEAIGNMFSDDSLLYNPSEFERKLLNQLNRVAGLWDKLPLQIGDLIIKIIEDTQEAFEEGYLYVQNYDKADEYFESEDINNYIVQFVKNLPDQIRKDYLKKLMEVLENYGYSTFMSVHERLF